MTEKSLLGDFLNKFIIQPYIKCVLEIHPLIEELYFPRDQSKHETPDMRQLNKNIPVHGTEFTAQITQKAWGFSIVKHS